MTSEPQGQTLTVPQAAEYLGISTRSAQREVKDTGQLAGIPLIEICGRKRVSRVLLEQLLQTGQVAS